MTGDIDVLTAAGWHPGRDAGDTAMLAVLEVAALGWELFPAAEQALRAYHGLRIAPSGPGQEVAPTGAVVHPREAQYAGGPFHSLGQRIGTRFFPFGRTDSDVPLAVDELGRLFGVDHGGARLLGESVAAGLDGLARGRMPVRLAVRRSAWEIAPLPAEELLEGAVRIALSVVYVLHRHGVYDARALRLRVTAMRGIGETLLDRAFPLPAGALGDAASPLVGRMSAALEQAGASVQGCEMRLDVLVPAGVAGPFESFRCSVAVGSSAARPAGVVVGFSGGVGACLGWGAEVFDAVGRELGRLGGGRV